ncbi:tetratricopeptide repeat protein [Aquimarina agarivorans]|uniref:tetratricopeptide repeat protein n=1 Tax=Aquimarina agarivorans TaxID=980584 RepID=UPI000248EB61|nr:tetratricopeptide repeat protein [Aquimarina agarivorans]
MKKLIFSLLYVFIPLFVLGQQQNDIVFSQANEAYNKGDYNKSVELYKSIEKTGNASVNLYFNLANSYYKLQKIAPSIYYYEKALQLAPGNKEVLANYTFAKNMRIDKIDPLPKGFLSRLYTKLVSMFKVDTWAWLSVVFIFLFAVCFVVFYRAVSSQQRKVFFAGWTFSIVLSAFCVLVAFLTVTNKKNNRYAIIFAKEIKIQSEPNSRSEKLYTLHEGTKVKLLEAVDDWRKVKLSDGKVGWLPQKEVKAL